MNSIPDYAEFQANARTVPEFDNHAVISEVQAVIDELNKEKGFDLEVQVTADQPAVFSDPNSALIQAILEAAKGRPSLQVPALFESMGKVVGRDLRSMAEKNGFTELKPITAAGTTDAAQFMRKNKGLNWPFMVPECPCLTTRLMKGCPCNSTSTLINYPRPTAYAVWSGFATTLHRSPAYLCRRTVLASACVTSGVADKHPVAIQSCRMTNALIVMFLAPRRSLCTSYPQFSHLNITPAFGLFALLANPQQVQAWLV